MSMQFYRCEKCGNFVAFLTKKSACTPTCCGQEMKELTANTVDAAQEKHVPVISPDGSVIRVKVGATAHPMLEAHSIQFIILETDRGWQKKDLHPGEAPEAAFSMTEEEHAVAAYEFCNLHGLWKTEI